MKNFFDEAIAAAQRGEALSRERDITAFKALMSKLVWTDADLDATTDLWCRAGLDSILNKQMEALQREWLAQCQSEHVEQAKEIAERIFRDLEQ